MRSWSRLSLLSLVAAALVACGDREIIPTGITPREANKDFSSVTIDPNQFVSITAGNDFNCAVQNSGKTYCWGNSDYWQVGQHGTYCFNERSRGYCVPTPTLLIKSGEKAPLLLDQVDAGAFHTCAIERGTDRQVWCWGWADVGELGFPSSSDRNAPGRVPGMTDASLVGAGGFSSCAQVPTGVFCWGRLNISTNGFLPYDTNVPVQWTGFTPFRDLSVGYGHACAIQSADGLVVCWGQNDAGQGANTRPQRESWAVPVATLFPSDVIRVVTQNGTTCVEDAGTIRCAGGNFAGIFGNGTIGTSSATPQTVLAGGPLHGITVGAYHACGLDSSGAAFCWGLNDWGQLGLGTGSTQPVTTPMPVTGGHRYRAIAAGANHTCAIRTDNLLYCWGSNQSGQLGTWLSWSSTPRPTFTPAER